MYKLCMYTLEEFDAFFASWKIITGSCGGIAVESDEFDVLI